MLYPKIDNLPKTHISHRAHREHRDIFLKLSFSQGLFCRKQENLFVSLCLCLPRSFEEWFWGVRFWLRLCLPCETFVALVSLGARPKPLNHALPLIIFLFILLTPLHSCTAETDPSKTQSKNVILYENWENKNFKNWDDDFRQGDTTIDSDPVYEGKYAIKQRASNPGSLVHFFGDHPGVNNKTIEDVTLESCLYFPPGFQWPSDGITLWTLACFEGWGAGYSKAKSAGKPLTWAPYYSMIALKGNGSPMMFLTRADDLGGPGELYKKYDQNIGETKLVELGSWANLKFRLKLNTPGKVNGIFQLWLNDDLKCNYSNIDFRGAYEKYGWNHLMMSFLGSPSKSNSQWISRDNILLTAGEETLTVPRVRKNIVKQALAPQATSKLDQPKHKDVFFEELFEDTNFSDRGWYDNTALILSDKEHTPGSKSSVEFHFKKGARTPISGLAIRHKFPETESVYVSFYVKYSKNWEGSNKPYHPHEIYMLTNEEGEWAGPAYTHLTAYIEQNEGEPLLGIQDGKNVNEKEINVDLTYKTETRAVAGCNGNSDATGKSSCYRVGKDHWNGKSWRAGDIFFNDATGDKYKNDWHFIEAFFRLNSITDGKGIPDGVVKYWFDGKLIIDHENILMRTGIHPNMKFNQFLIGPYMGDGSPVEQTMWIDNLTVANNRGTPDIKAIPKTRAPLKPPTGLKINIVP